MGDAKSSTTITTETIKRICVQLGFYRHPICNEKLYLHHKGFDSIDTDAFDPYTDVKVLWLESNALTVIPCGRDSIPIQVNTEEEEQQQQATEESGVAQKRPVSDGCSKSAQMDTCKAAHVDCCADWTTAPYRTTANVETQKGDDVNNDGVDPTVATLDTVDDGEKGEETHAAAETKKDVFQSLYPTLRQLYLHNNALRDMPDLSGFQRLDTVNLASNCIRAVRPLCAAFEAKVARYEEAIQEKAESLLANSKSMQTELRARTIAIQQEQQQQQEGRQGGEEEAEREEEEEEDGRGTTPKEDDNKNGNATCSSAAAAAARAEELEMWRQRVSAYAEFCPHEPLDVAENGKLSDDVPPARLNPCSSLR
ncbi:hypothetical protein DQ04_03001080, partial [Trypanosoma grayi]|uniref:hypothetical protein n=1 Tax=Trypanosoma grayi TaxID=71804 RepID=UPI0004F40EDF